MADDAREDGAALEGWAPVMPPWSTTESGDLRRVGVEIEMIGPDVASIAELLRERLDGTIETRSRYESEVHGDEAGPWRVELDFGYLKEKGRAQAGTDGDTTLLEEFAESVVRTGAEAVVPVEVISPPLFIPRLAMVQSLVEDLRRLGAQGTRAGLTYAFGMQLNPEVPRRDATTIVRYLKAFLCLYDWLLRECRVDLTRKLTGFSAPFPAEYVRKVVDVDYRPELAALIDDYLASNPTRNRALDLLPLFAELDEARVRKVVEDRRVKSRPALHYRLPNSEIDDPSWGVHLAWGRWLQVEFLAADEGHLDDVCRRYAVFLDQPLGTLRKSWAEEIEPWLTPLGDR